MAYQQKPSPGGGTETPGYPVAVGKVRHAVSGSHAHSSQNRPWVVLGICVPVARTCQRVSPKLCGPRAW